MFSPFSDPFLNSYLEERDKNMDEEFNLNNDTFRELFPNLPSPIPAEPSSLFDGVDDSFFELLSSADDFSPEIFSNTDANGNLKVEAKNEINADVKSDLEGEYDDDSQSSRDEDLEILRKTSHDHFFDKTTLPVVIQEKRNFILKPEEQRKFREYYDAKTDNELFPVGREVTVGIDTGARVKRPAMFKREIKSRGAVYAKMYRQKNKDFVDRMQQDLDRLTEENTDLKQTVDEMSGQMVSLKQEIRYLRSVLANQSQLSVLLKSVRNTPGQKFRFPLDFDGNNRDDEKRLTRKRKVNDDSDVKMNAGKLFVRNEQYANSAGVCLHVNGDSISLEFCARCAKDSRCDSSN